MTTSEDIIRPDGPNGTRVLLVEYSSKHIAVLDDKGVNLGPEVCLDWWGDRLQVLVYAAGEDEPVMTVCFNPDGTVAKDQDAWRNERDKVVHEQA